MAAKNDEVKEAITEEKAVKETSEENKNLKELMERIEQLEGAEGKDAAEIKKAEADFSERKKKSNKLLSDRVPVRLRYDTKSGDSVFACVNGRAIQIKRGERVEIPEAFDEVLRNAEEQSEAALKHIQRSVESSTY